ncbi:hypothetical protein AX016_1602 [Cellulophaga sp. RHA19]|uniref:hypothetical protein n=1 Tax=Cellulophaga sp. RHA19 TaxID=1798237 RepID=UPI000C2B6FFA|nr:hypothetical protein [Cellulophaga sp. RHA19]PKB43408.1 hypothetical protein AX016_1602 [Cellulophaga sp. RHA19]
MLKSTFVLISLVITTSFTSTTTSNCDNAYSASSYALNYAKKSLKADNFDHQKFYANKAFIALEKTKKLMKECDCADAKNSVLSGLENIDKAATPKDWDLGRHYAKLALLDVENTITALDIFTQNGINTVSSDIELKNNALLLEAVELEKQRVALESEIEKLLSKKRALAIKIAENIQKQRQN